MITVADLATLTPAQLGQVSDLMRHGWTDYYGDLGNGDAVSAVQQRAVAGSLPLGVAALSGTKVIGTAAVAATSFGVETGVSGPWLIGLIVAADYRNKGVASSLVGSAEQLAKRMAFKKLYTTTRSAKGLMARRGWHDCATVSDGALDWHVMYKDLA